MLRRDRVPVRIAIIVLSGMFLVGCGPPIRISSGQTISGIISNYFEIFDGLGAQKAYSFTATAGDTVRVQVAKSSESGDFHDAGVVLYAPDGSEVGSTCSDTGTANYENTDLPMDGTYILIVKDCAGDPDTTGSFNISLMNPVSVTHPTDPDGGIIDSGQERSGIIGVVGDMDGFRFSALAGNTVRVEVESTESGNYHDAGVVLYDPEGNWRGSTCSDTGTAIYQDTGLPTDGTYSLIVMDCTGDADTAGSYDISLTVGE